MILGLILTGGAFALIVWLIFNLSALDLQICAQWNGCSPKRCEAGEQPTCPLIDALAAPI